MTLTPSLFRWRDQINQHLPNLSKSQAMALALWSVGMILARSASLTAVYLALAEWLSEAPNTVRQRLREWYLPAARKSGAKRGTKRCDWNPASCFGSLLIWVRSRLPHGRLLLAIDATQRKDKIVVLCISVVVGGCAIPVAWRCLIATEPEAWTPHWQELIQTISEAIPSHQSVTVLADRGLWSRSLYEAITALKWHPLLRINGPVGEQSHPKTALFRVKGKTDWRPISSFAPRKGSAVRIQGEAFKSQEIPCTLIIFFGTSAKEPWYLITDEATASGHIYGMRFWIEHQFKKIKSDGWHWEKSRITDPIRVRYGQNACGSPMPSVCYGH